MQIHSESRTSSALETDESLIGLTLSHSMWAVEAESGGSDAMVEVLCPQTVTP